ncbi:hypothetical protein NC652_024715 [Populus alba x Populus x berolinensis]|nr:hypothetical protein NC652_024715 [Populus alba x Populus x berolinensis]
MAELIRGQAMFKSPCECNTAVSSFCEQVARTINTSNLHGSLEVISSKEETHEMVKVGEEKAANSILSTPGPKEEGKNPSTKDGAMEILFCLLTKQWRIWLKKKEADLVALVVLAALDGIDVVEDVVVVVVVADHGDASGGSQ